MAGLLDNSDFGPTDNLWDAPGGSADAKLKAAYSPMNAPQSFEDVQQILLDQAQKAIEAGYDEKEVMARVQAQTEKLGPLVEKYGAAAFTPKVSSKLRVEDADTTGLIPPTHSYGGMLEEIRDPMLSAAMNYTPAGLLTPLAEGLTGGYRAGENLAKFAIDKALGGDTAKLDSLGAFVEGTEEAGKYARFEPQTEAGKAIQKPMEWLGEGAKKAGEKVEELGGSPELAAATEVGIQLLPFAAGAEGIKAFRGLKAETLADTARARADYLKSKEIPKTGDPDFDAGIREAEKVDLGKTEPFSSKEHEQGDLFSRSSVLSQDMFEKGPEGIVPADLLESRRKTAEEASIAKVTGSDIPQRTPESQRDLEMEYIQDQQDRLDRGSQQEDLLSRRGAIPEAYLGIPHADMPQGDVNTLMHRQMLQGLADRGQLRNEPEPVRSPEPTTGQLFEPSKNETVDQNQVQDRLDLPIQPDLFSAEQAGVVPKPAEPVKTETPATTPKVVKDTVESVRARLNEKFGTKATETVDNESSNPQTSTPEFKSWFGASKVADENGKPIQVYHGTSKDTDFSSFKTGQRGSWFTTDPKDASSYAVDNDSTNLKYNPDTRTYDKVNTKSRVIPAYLKIENPYEMTQADWDKYKYVQNYAKYQRDFFSQLRRQGYDGVKVDEKTWVAFEPTQIKSSIGNSGAFDPRNPKISASPEQVTSAHAEILNLHDNGQLTSRHVLDAVIDAAGLESSGRHKEASAFAQALSDLEDKFGGGSTKIHVLDPNNKEHATALSEFLLDNKRFAPGGASEGRWGAFYDPKRNSIFVKSEANLTPNVLVHETAHAVTWRAMAAAEHKLLNPAQQMAFNNLQTVFDELKRHLDRAAEGGYTDDVNAGDKLSYYQKELNRRNREYGLTDIHEMVSEIYSNPEFRDFLRAQKLDTMAQSKMGLSRTVYGKISTMFDAVVAPIKKMLGLSPKAENALDAIFAAHDQFHKSFSDPLTRGIKKLSNEEKMRAAPEEVTEERKPLKADVTDPLSSWQKLASSAKTIGKMFTTARGPTREFRTTQEEAKGFEANALMKTSRDAKLLEKMMDKEGAPASAVRAYMQPHQEDATKAALDKVALDNYPKTRQFVDDFMKKPAEENAKTLAGLIAKNPNATLKDLLLAEKIHDNPAYTMRAYQPQAFTEGLFRNAQIADQKQEAGKPLTVEEGKAKTAVDNLTGWVRENLIPTPGMRAGSAEGKTMPQLRNMAKALGLRPAQVLKGLKKAEKPEALVNAINAAVPEKDVDTAVKRLAYDIAGITQSGTTVVAKYYRGARFGDILTARESVPPEIQAVWGKVQDPASIMVQTLMKQARGISNLTQQYDIKAKGEGKWLFPTKVGAPDGYTAQLKGPKFGPLQDMWTTPENKLMLSSQLELSTIGDSLLKALHSGNPDEAMKALLAKSSVGLWSKGVGLFKSKRLLTDPGYYIMNLAGGPSIMLAHGIVDPRLAGRGVLTQFAELSPKFVEAFPEGPLKDQMKQDLEHIVKSGMNEFQMQGEIMDDIAARKLAEAVNSGMQKDPISPVKMLGSVLAKARDAGMSVFSGLDSWAKRAALLQRIDVLKSHYDRVGTPKDLEDIRKEASDWVKDTTVTYSRAPVAVRLTEKLGFSQGLVYSAETIRNAYNSLAHGLSDIKRGGDTGDRILQLHGAKQILGTGAAVNYMGTMISATGAAILSTVGIASKMLNPTDDQQEFLQRKGSRFEGQRPEKLTGTGDKDNQYFWSPGDLEDYYYQLSQPTHAIQDMLARQQAGQEMDWSHEAKGAIGALTGSFFRNSFPKKILDMISGNEPYWYKNAPEAYEQANKFYRETFGVSNKVADGMLSLEEIFRPGFLANWSQAKESDANPAIKTMIGLGVGVTKISNTADLEARTGHGLANEFAAVKKNLSSSVSSEINYSDDVLKKDYLNAMKDDYEVLKKFRSAIEFAKANGQGMGEIYQAAKIGGIPTEAIMQVASGNLNPALLLKTNLTDDITQKMIKYRNDPEKVQKLMDTFTHRMLLLNDLTSKYATMTEDQLKALP